MAEDNNKHLGYQPDIRYEEDYGSKLRNDSDKWETHSLPELNPSSKDPTVPQFDPSFGVHIDNLMNEVAELTKGLPDRIHVIVNQVFKPIYKDWKENIKGSLYPTYIPDPDDVIFIPNPGTIKYPPTNPGGNNNDPGTGGGNPGGGNPGNGGGGPGDDDDPGGGYPGGGDNPGGGGDDPGGGGPGRDDPGDEDEWPGDDPIEGDDPEIGDIPEVGDDPETGDDPYEDIYKDIDEESFDIDLPIDIQFPEIDKMEIIKLEYVKNIMDLYEYYVSRLKDTLSSYYLQLVSAMVGIKSSTEMAFLMMNISQDMALSTTDNEGRSLMDASLRSEVIGNLKLDFLENTFRLESTLYHMKSFKASNELRQRYYSTDKNKDSTKDASTSAKVTEAMRIMYDRKYEDAYINYYKYLNSSLKVLDDAFKDQATGFKTKATINRKK